MRTIYCGELRAIHIGKRVTICGWLNKIRNLGKLVFIELRDIKGIVQAYIEIENKTTFLKALKLHNELCIQLDGLVRARPVSQINNSIATGDIEVLVIGFIILNEAAILPIDIDIANNEEQRLKHIYIDLRSSYMTDSLIKRTHVINYIRKHMNQKGFLDIETPYLSKYSTEGSREYIIPSRTHRTKYYVLPQSPQVYKQLLMVSGYDRYYQIVRCFRDEDLRSDRQPEFTQLDIETSFMNIYKLHAILEDLVKGLWLEFKSIKLNQFYRMTYKEAMSRFGTDKPDLSSSLEYVDIKELISNDNVYKGKLLHIPHNVRLTIDKVNEYKEYVEKTNKQRFIWIKLTKQLVSSSNIDSSLGFGDLLIKAIKHTNANIDDFIFIIYLTNPSDHSFLTILKEKITKDLQIHIKRWSPVWITDFPLFRMTANNGYIATHHPFTAPIKNIDLANANVDPIYIAASSYDLVINGYEIGSGSVRIDSFKTQKDVFNILNLSKKEQEESYGCLLNALRYGAPPHTGFAFGLDRLLMLIVGSESIKDVIAFPKSNSGVDLMLNAPSEIGRGCY